MRRDSRNNFGFQYSPARLWLDQVETAALRCAKRSNDPHIRSGARVEADVADRAGLMWLSRRNRLTLRFNHGEFFAT
jgi:hypothetical protein